MAALVRHLQPDRLRLDPVPLAEPQPGRRLRQRAHPVGAGNPLLGAGGRRDPAGGRAAAAARTPDGGDRAANRSPPTARAWRCAGRRRPDRRCLGPQPGRAPLHLLPLLTMAREPERFETIAEMEAESRPGREGEPHGDDSLIGRFDRWGLRRFRAWDGVKAVALTTLLLLIFAGGSVRAAADELKPGLGRDIVKAIGGPAG